MVVVVMVGGVCREDVEYDGVGGGIGGVGRVGGGGRVGGSGSDGGGEVLMVVVLVVVVR